MDPDETLKEIRRLTDLARIHRYDNVRFKSYSFQIIDLFDELDQWIMRRGYLPAEWEATTF